MFGTAVLYIHGGDAVFRHCQFVVTLSPAGCRFFSYVCVVSKHHENIAEVN